MLLSSATVVSGRYPLPAKKKFRKTATDELTASLVERITWTDA
jgi:hypothetical protein